MKIFLIKHSTQKYTKEQLFQAVKFHQKECLTKLQRAKKITYCQLKLITTLIVMNLL